MKQPSIISRNPSAINKPMRGNPNLPNVAVQNFKALIFQSFGFSKLLIFQSF